MNPILAFASGYLTGVVVASLASALDLPWWACVTLGAVSVALVIKIAGIDSDG